MNDDMSIWSKAEPLSTALTDEEVREAFAGITGKAMPAFSAESESTIAPVNTWRRHAKRRKVFTLALAACLVIVLGATAVAATQGPPLKVIASWLGVNPKNTRQVRVLHKVGSVINQSVSDSGTTVTVGEIAGDSRFFYVSLDVASPAIPANDKGSYTFNSVDFQIEGDTQKDDSGMGLLDATPDENGVLHFLCWGDLSNTALLGKNLRLTVRRLTRNPDVGSNQINGKEIVPGTWVFTFPLNYKDTSRNLPDGSLKVAGKTYQISQISISAVSLHYHLSGADLSGPEWSVWERSMGFPTDHAPSIIDVNQQVPVRIIFKDGSRFPSNHRSKGIELTNDASLNNDASPDMPPSDSSVDVFISLGKIIDPAQIATISFGDYTITMK